MEATERPWIADPDDREGWYGRKFYEDADKEIRIRNGSWAP